MRSSSGRRPSRLDTQSVSSSPTLPSSGPSARQISVTEAMSSTAMTVFEESTHQMAGVDDDVGSNATLDPISRAYSYDETIEQNAERLGAYNNSK